MTHRWNQNPLVLSLAFASVTFSASAAAQTPAAPHNVVQLSASAQQEAPQDWLTVVISHRTQGADATTVQRQLKTAVDGALRHIRPRVRDGELEVSSGAMTVQPRHNREGQIIGWYGSADLLLQGRDLTRIAATAGDTPAMVVAQMAFSLSPQAQQSLEQSIRSAAIARFRSSAQQVAQDFGFGGYTLREVTVSQGGGDFAPRPRMMLAGEAGPAMAAAPVPVEPGRTLVQVTVSGAVQLH